MLAFSLPLASLTRDSLPVCQPRLLLYQAVIRSIQWTPHSLFSHDSLFSPSCPLFLSCWPYALLVPQLRLLHPLNPLDFALKILDPYIFDIFCSLAPLSKHKSRSNFEKRNETNKVLSSFSPEHNLRLRTLFVYIRPSRFGTGANARVK